MSSYTRDCCTSSRGPLRAFLAQVRQWNVDKRVQQGKTTRDATRQAWNFIGKRITKYVYTSLRDGETPTTTQPGTAAYVQMKQMEKLVGPARREEHEGGDAVGW